MRTSPRAEAERAEHHRPPGPGRDERFAGYGVMGLPFQSGHYLAMRRFPANPFGRPYHSVWHRNPDGVWAFYGDTPTDQSCTRYFDAAIGTSSTSGISTTWTGPFQLTVEVGNILTWSIDLERTRATALMTGAGRLLPRAMWDNRGVLTVMGRAAAPVLRAGRVQLAGTTPNGQWFRTNPRLLWSVADSSAIVEGIDLGPPGPLAEQARLGDFWLPQRGIFAVGEGTFEGFDPSRHHIPRPATMPRTDPPTTS